jgi:beta-phosphoglucomutase-like phosphatase (HAD superfamily)
MSVAILDIDGTLVDTNYQHTFAWYRAGLRRGRGAPSLQAQGDPGVATPPIG